MSTIIMSKCWPLQMPPTAKAVLISLADNANDHGVCWPSLTKIAERTCFGRTAVIDAIKWLESHGVVTVDRESHSNCYKIVPNGFVGDSSGQFHYVYKITHLPSGMFYVGLRTTSCLPEQDSYWGSGKDCAWLDSVRPECEKVILGQFGSRDEAAQAETGYIREAINDSLCLNRRISTSGQSSGPGGGPSGRRTVREADFNKSAARADTSVSRTCTVREADTNRQEPSITVNKATVSKRATAPPCPDDVDPQTWADWLTLRKAKKAPVTETVLRGANAEADKAGMSLEQFLRIWCARGSQGLQADWLKPHERAGPASHQQQMGKTAIALQALEDFGNGGLGQAGNR